MQQKAGVGLLAMSGAILLLSGAIIILSHIKSDGLDQALKAIAKLELLFAGLIVATHFAKDCKSTLVIISANWSSCCSNRHSFYDKSGKFSIGYKRVITGYACFQHSYYVYTFG